ncbi:hypothetical protein CE143_08740 [Photorhabdus luminescens]|uniref:Baseplate protein J-like domain-containing protein n=1 Tax=Photorhabdus akhurstii TaxID=171438 RepID=A0ABX8LS43_9GAMM|nr:hypothetical protein [Photorhabdus akhurstii]QXF33226.1 hypothetical protein B0X70_08825 [Photorhabdus akhurstii]UJD75022.1 hypothetical protein CE143_08740 [Photorhabdus luminescens]
MGQAELDNKLSAIVPDTAFKLDERSTLDILNWLKEYTAIIPFDQEKKQFWDSFYFIKENDPQRLADIYQNIDKANGLLPPHQAFVLAFLKLLETSKVLLNTFPARHRALYYRQLLGLKPKNARADSVAIEIALNTDITEYLVPLGTLFEAGQDRVGTPLQYASDENLLANQGALTDLRWYRKDNYEWQSATLLDRADNIELPENSFQLLNPTSNDIPILSGYLITSSLFAMSKGERNITLTLTTPWDGNEKHIIATISSGNHWLSLSVVKEDTQHLTLHLSANDDPISPPDGLDGMAFDVPILKLGTIQGTTLPTITAINISINGNRDVLYASDGGIEQTDTTSFPFGQSPLLGSGFNLIAPEWYGTENATLTITPQWIGLPTENFSKWYEKYHPKPAANNVFKIQGYLVIPQERITLNKGEAQPLFSETQLPPYNGEQPNDPPQGKSLVFTLPAMNYPLADSESPNDWPASVRIELAEQDFLHMQYWQDPTNKNPPYTPQISALQVEFSAKAKTEQFSVYPLTPFGWDEAVEAVIEKSKLTHEAFYLGFTDVLPGQTLSLYWQLAGIKALTLSWFYLNKKNIWNPLDNLVHDQTHNLSNRGLWRTLLPQDASNQASQMPTGRYWLKAEIVNKVNPQDYPRIKGILYNATTATLINAETIEPDHFINGLAANSIQQLTKTSVAVSGVTQPWASWNGHPPETEQDFLKRVPTRLSNRNRVLSWDNMVTLLKEHFVNIFDVKYPSANELTKIPAPETQQLIVIPNSHYKDNDDALRPTLNPARLAEMVNWISQLSSPWTTLKIDNPKYVDVLINYELTFVAGVNPDYGHHQLQQELSRKYMPWAEDTAISVTTGNRIDYYQLLATIQQSPLVERVTSLTLKKHLQPTEATGDSVEAAVDEVLISIWSGSTYQNQGADNE